MFEYLAGVASFYNIHVSLVYIAVFVWAPMMIGDLTGQSIAMFYEKS